MFDFWLRFTFVAMRNKQNTKFGGNFDDMCVSSRTRPKGRTSQGQAFSPAQRTVSQRPEQTVVDDAVVKWDDDGRTRRHQPSLKKVNSPQQKIKVRV
jgi:hypothetical protein